LLIQHKISGIRSINFFNRSWAEYKVGFNDSNGNYWLGNDLLHQLTNTPYSAHKLRFDLHATNGSWYYAEYSRFIVDSEASKYRMHVSGYSGNAGGYGFSYHDGSKFTTYDRDYDQYYKKTAVSWGAGFWHNYCCRACVNSERYRDNFRWYVDGSNYYVLQTSRMWLTC